MKKIITIIGLVFVSNLVSVSLSMAEREIVSCFDYYKFGSVQTEINAPITQVLSGTVISFSGNIENSNPYPLVNGTLYVKVFRDRNLGKDSDGPDVVDQFVVKKNISISANSNYPINFDWNVPAYAVTGNYKLATFFITSDKFNLSGLSFTDDIVGNSVNFSVKGEQKETVQFNKKFVKINGNKYYFAAYPLRVKKNDSALITAEITNSSKLRQTANLTWEIYEWDSQDNKNLIRTESQIIEISANNNTNVSLNINEDTSPVYLAIGTLEWNGTKSIINVRYVRDDVNKIRINFPSINSYPLKKGKENTLFSCFHNVGNQTVQNAELKLTLLDQKNRIIHQTFYKGEVTGDMMGTASKFIPENDQENFTLKAELFEGSNIVDTAIIHYNCSKFEDVLCNERASDFKNYTNESYTKSVNSFLEFDLFKKYYKYILFVGIVVLLGALGFLFIRKNNNNI